MHRGLCRSTVSLVPARISAQRVHVHEAASSTSNWVSIKADSAARRGSGSRSWALRNTAASFGLRICGAGRAADAVDGSRRGALREGAAAGWESGERFDDGEPVTMSIPAQVSARLEAPECGERNALMRTSTKSRARSLPKSSRAE